MNPYEPETPPLWVTFLDGCAGTMALLPSFIWWLCRVALRKLEAFDWTVTVLQNDSAYWRFWSRMGDGWAYALLVLYLVCTGRVELAGHISACIVIAWGSAGALKMIFRRRRPHDVLVARINPKFKPSRWSFPSQHAACVFAFALAVLGVGPQMGRVAVLSGTSLGFVVANVCWARVSSGRHFVSDVLAGIAVGVAAGVWG